MLSHDVNTKWTWETVYTGSVTAGSSITLSQTGLFYALRFGNSEGASTHVTVAFIPNVGGSYTYYIPVMFGTTSTYARVAINGTSLTIVAVGNSGLYLKAVYALG